MKSRLKLVGPDIRGTIVPKIAVEVLGFRSRSYYPRIHSPTTHIREVVIEW